MTDIIQVKVADYKVAASPLTLISYGLGSCVGISLFDEDKKIGGLAHIMLPKGDENTDPKFFPRYADRAIKLMLSDMEAMGCDRGKLVAKFAGGSSMFPGLKKDDKSIGERNVDAVVEIFNMLKIPVSASDTGGNHGRSIRFNTETGEMKISSVRQETIII